MFASKHSNECLMCDHCPSFARSGDCEDQAHMRVMDKCIGCSGDVIRHAESVVHYSHYMHDVLILLSIA
jgi:hypothetical protein